MLIQKNKYRITVHRYLPRKYVRAIATYHTTQAKGLQRPSFIQFKSISSMFTAGSCTSRKVSFIGFQPQILSQKSETMTLIKTRYHRVNNTFCSRSNSSGSIVLLHISSLALSIYSLAYSNALSFFFPT